MSCPPDEALACYIEDGLFPEDRERLEEHVAGCERCATVLADALSSRGGEPADPTLSRFMFAFRTTWRHLWCRLRGEIFEPVTRKVAIKARLFQLLGVHDRLSGVRASGWPTSGEKQRFRPAPGIDGENRMARPSKQRPPTAIYFTRKLEERVS